MALVPSLRVQHSRPMLSTPSHQFGFQWCHSGTSSLSRRGGGGYDMMPELGTSDLHGTHPIYRIRLNQGDSSSPLKPYSRWDSFLSGGSQLPRCCNWFLCFYEEILFFCLEKFFIFSIFFLPPKENIGTYVPSWLWLASVDSSVLRVVGPSPPVLYQTLLGTWCSTVI